MLRRLHTVSIHKVEAPRKKDLWSQKVVLKQVVFVGVEYLGIVSLPQDGECSIHRAEQWIFSTACLGGLHQPMNAILKECWNLFTL
jgi:hypothetical protein